MPTILIAAAILFSLGLSPAHSKPHPHEYCKEQASAAGALMGARQSGVLMQELMEALKDEKEKTILLLAEEVYRRPLIKGEEEKSVAIKEFQNEIYGACIKASRQ